MRGTALFLATVALAAALAGVLWAGGRPPPALVGVVAVTVLASGAFQAARLGRRPSVKN
jgi:hypothetical protein